MKSKLLFFLFYAGLYFCDSLVRRSLDEDGCFPLRLSR